MTTQDFIRIAVDNEFDATYTRNLVKCYLYKALLINPYTKNPYSNHQIAKDLGLDRHKVAKYLFHMEVYFKCNDNSFLNNNFAPKFEAVKLACEMHIKVQRYKDGIESAKRAENSLNCAKLAVINEYQLN